MLRYLFLLLIFVANLTATETLYLGDRFANSQAGDYLVAYINNSYTLLHIHTHSKKQLIIEEITVPKHLVKEQNDWRSWVAKGALGHTGWVMYEINPHSGEILEFYSFTHKAWTEISDLNNFISNLLRLKFTPIPEEDRKKIGPTPMPGNLDCRSNWNPPAYFEGKRIKNVLFSSWRALWPSDGSELAGKTIEAYLAEEKPYPNYFPYWVEVRGNIARASIRITDTGKEMVSPKKEIPIRPPRFLSNGKLTGDIWIVSLEAPLSLEHFTLAATPVEGSWRKKIVLPHKTSRNGKKVTLSVAKKDLKELEPGMRYHFTVSSQKWPTLADRSHWTYCHKEQDESSNTLILNNTKETPATALSTVKCDK